MEKQGVGNLVCTIMVSVEGPSRKWTGESHLFSKFGKNSGMAVYPSNFETKIGIDRLRDYVCQYCLYDPGREEIRKLDFTNEADKLRIRLKEVEEFRQLLLEGKEFPVENFIDISGTVTKLRIEGNYLEEEELFGLKKVLDSVRAILAFLKKDEENKYPALKMMAGEVKSFPLVTERLNNLMNKHGKIRDNASRELAEIRHDLHQKEASISKQLYRILEKARKDGLVDEDASLAVRNGRTVIPIAASNKKLIRGYIHDESGTGKTAYIEPLEIVEANNELRELELREKREIIRILMEFTAFLRPYREELGLSHEFLAKTDSVRARARFARDISAIHPNISENPEVEWNTAIHPLLLLSFREASREKEIVPLDIRLDHENRILIISGPNAGGKSVCLQTLGILQYMFQCGFLVPVASTSTFGIFDSIFLDMGDEQSIEDDLSTYSSHLVNMKYFTRNAGKRSMVLIDEFGSGTEPSLGAAIAESVLENLNASGVYGLITTHYTNLKHYASSNPGLINGAMLFDTGRMLPLFKLDIGRPGSSFAFEIARKIGLPEEIIKSAEARVGQDRIDFDRALKDLIRDKKYWENKRQRIRLAEKRLSELVEKYDAELTDTEKLRKKILKEAKDQAEWILSESNRKIENTIREIREAEAEKEKTREIRKELESFRTVIRESGNIPDQKKSEADDLKKKIEELRLRNKQINKRKPETVNKEEDDSRTEIGTGDYVRMKGQDVPGQVMEIKGKTASVAFGHFKTRVKTDKLEKLKRDSIPSPVRSGSSVNLGDWSVGKRRLNFTPDIDVRGKRADEALQIIAEFIDEAIMVQVHDLRILHGTGSGILRELIRQQLSAMDVVEYYADEHVERGGAGITLIRLIS